MFLHKFFQKLFLSSSRKRIKDMPPKERKSFLYEQLYKYMFVKKILMSKLHFIYLAKENNVPNMFEDGMDEESIKKELMSLLDEGYEALSNLYLGDFQKKAIDELSREEAINVVEWIEKFFIEGFVRLEEYEKCDILRKFADRIKEVKQLN